MTIRRVYVDQQLSNFIHEGVDNYTFLQEYHDNSRYLTTNACGLYFNDSGTKMYIGEYSSAEINEYNLSIPWDINTSQWNQQESLNGTISAITSFSFDQSGALLFCGSDELGSDNISVYNLGSPWNISTINHSDPTITAFPDSDLSLGISVSKNNPIGNLLYVNDSGISFGRVQNTDSNTHTMVTPILFELEMSSFGTEPVGTYMGEADGRFFVSYYESGLHKVRQYYSFFDGTFEEEKNITLTGSVSGSVINNESIYLSPYYEYLYTLNPSGVIQQYSLTSDNYYGTKNAGTNLQNLFDLNKIGSSSASSYINEGTVAVNNVDYWTSVNSGIVHTNTQLEIPFMTNVSGISLEVAYQTLDADMYIKNIELRTKVINGISNGFNFYSEWFGYNIGSEINFTSGSGIKNIPLTSTSASIHNAMGNKSPLVLTFDVYSPTSGNKITAMNVWMSGDSYPASDATGIPLYVSGMTQAEGFMDLFLANYYTSGAIDLFIHGLDSINSGIPLFIEGHTPINNNFNLFMSGFPVNDAIPLYIPGGLEASNHPLYMYGFDTITDNHTLFMRGFDTISSGITLYIDGHGFESGLMPLYTVGQTPHANNDNFPLYIWSTTNSGIMSTNTLFIGDEGNPEPEYNLNLVLGAIATGTDTDNIPLYIYNDNQMTDSVSLFMKNEWVVSSGSLPLYITTPSGTEGSVPNSSTMPLYISRTSEGIDHQLSMYMAAPIAITSGLDFTILGSYSGVNDNVNLFLDGAAEEVNYMEMFTKGL